MDGGAELPGGWVAIDSGFVVGVGPGGAEPAADRTINAEGCLVTPGLINTHHHIFQNLTRSLPRPGRAVRLAAPLPPLGRLDEEAVYPSAFSG